MSCGSCIEISYSHTLTTHMVALGINFCPGPAGCVKHFGTDLKYTIVLFNNFNLMFIGNQPATLPFSVSKNHTKGSTYIRVCICMYIYIYIHMHILQCMEVCCNLL